MELTVNKDLAFRDITGQIGDRVGNIYKEKAKVSLRFRIDNEVMLYRR